MTSLTGMQLQSNQIVGPVPSEWESLIVFDSTIHLENNRLSGRLPSSLQLDLLAGCNLAGNRFSCPLQSDAVSECGAKSAVRVGPFLAQEQQRERVTKHAL